jgi:hypothetical protein
MTKYDVPALFLNNALRAVVFAGRGNGGAV